MGKIITRQAISYEGDGKYAVKNMLVQPESLWWSTDETILVVDDCDVMLAEARPVGKVLSIERRDDGLIVADIEWNNKEDIYTNTTIFAKDVVRDEVAEKKNPNLKFAVRYARIRAVITGANMPWIDLNDDWLS